MASREENRVHKRTNLLDGTTDLINKAALISQLKFKIQFTWRERESRVTYTMISVAPLNKWDIPQRCLLWKTSNYNYKKWAPNSQLSFKNKNEEFGFFSMFIGMKFSQGIKNKTKTDRHLGVWQMNKFQLQYFQSLQIVCVQQPSMKN